ncbi:hypothetical protein LAZ67_8000849 [Cordylochernes scorpioides]|uniref:Uncharacterized protein n=1 Tax=Cordylochernes scorpioides TaxID=51811 RepID=A0ABY6KQ82_9ARAC|nr:hypothetical protein LAZ67_8000849 [Cordylochernes scorpioides]
MLELRKVIAKENVVLMRGRHVSIVKISEEVYISNILAHFILTEDSAKNKAAVKFVPKLLTAEQRQLRVEVLQEMLDSSDSDLDFTTHDL